MIENARRREAILAIPGVTDVAFGTAVPGMENGIYGVTVPHPEDAQRGLQIRLVGIDEHYPDLVGLHLLYGRLPDATENNVGLVNQALARDVWGREDVVGELVPFSLFQA